MQSVGKLARKRLLEEVARWIFGREMCTSLVMIAGDVTEGDRITNFTSLYQSRTSKCAFQIVTSGCLCSANCHCFCTHNIHLGGSLETLPGFLIPVCVRGLKKRAKIVSAEKPTMAKMKKITQNEGESN